MRRGAPVAWGAVGSRLPAGWRRWLRATRSSPPPSHGAQQPRRGPGPAMPQWLPMVPRMPLLITAPNRFTGWLEKVAEAV